jgi:hypothetical protein
MHLFQDRLALKAFSRSYARPPGSFSDAMELLHEGFLEAIPETRLEQSFNERLFAELFGYRTLLRDGAGYYHLQPKNFHGNSRYDDFSLGFYGPDSETTLVSCELKSLLTDLDKPQTSGTYGGLTPVQQAMSAVANVASVRWVIVSNFDEMRLYRIGDATRYEQIFLSDIHSTSDLRYLLALFSKRTLLADGVRDSLLEHLYNGRLENVVPPTPGRIRLLQHLMPHSSDQPELPFYRVEDALRRHTLLHCFDGPHIVNDRLVFTAPSDSGKSDWIVEATKSGVLQSSEYIEDQTDTSPIIFSGQDLLDRILQFLQQATAFYTILRLGNLDAAWYLDGIADATCRVSKEWCAHSQSIVLTLMAPKTIQESQTTMSKLTSLAKGATDQQLIQIALRAVRELLYPFSTRDPQSARTIRAIPQMKFDHALFTASD